MEHDTAKNENSDVKYLHGRFDHEFWLIILLRTSKNTFKRGILDAYDINSFMTEVLII